MSRFIPAAMGFLTFALTTGCFSSRGGGQPFTVLSDAAPETTWQELRRTRHDLAGFRTLARLRITTGNRRQSLKAEIRVDADRKLRIDGFTPLGTSAFTLYDEGDQVLFLNHLDRTYWNGPWAAFASSVSFLSTTLRPSDLAILLIGLPAFNVARTTGDEGSLIAEDEHVRFEVGRSGLRRVDFHASEETVVATYEPARFPPEKVTIRIESPGEAGSRTVEVEHLDLSWSSESLSKPRVDRSYRCCFLPKALVEQ